MQGPPLLPHCESISLEILDLPGADIGTASSLQLIYEELALSKTEDLWTILRQESHAVLAVRYGRLGEGRREYYLWGQACPTDHRISRHTSAIFFEMVSCAADSTRGCQQ